MEQPPPETLLSTHQVAEMCGSSDATIRYAARVGTLRGVKVRRVWQFTESEADSFCAELQERKRRRQSRVTRRRSFIERMRRAIQGSVALLHIAASIVSLLAAGVWDDFAPVGYALAAWNALAGAYAYVRDAWKRPLKGDGEGVDPDVVGWRRSRLADNGERADPVSSPQDGGAVVTTVPSNASFATLGVMTALQATPVIAAFAFGVVAATTHTEDPETPIPRTLAEVTQDTPPGAENNDGEASDSFTTCEAWLAGTGLEGVTLNNDVSRTDSARLVICSGSYGGITDITEDGVVSGDVTDVSISLVFPAPNAGASWAEPLAVAEAACTRVALPTSGLGGCLAVEQYGVILSVPVRGDLMVEVQVMNPAENTQELQRLAEQIVEQIAVNSRA